MGAFSVLLAASLAAGVSVLLQGCGGGGSGPSATTTTTTTTHHARTPPMSTPDMVKYLNHLYLGFNKSNDTSPLGVTISWAGEPQSFYKNIFCSWFTQNPRGATECYNGLVDCKMSACLMNHQMMVKAKNGTKHKGGGFVPPIQRGVGYILNQTKVESHYSRCSFIWDGASGCKYNRGCGDGAVCDGCSDKKAAFYDICPSTGQPCTADDAEVKRGFCSQFGGDYPVPPTHGNHTQCVFPGVSINYDYRSPSDWKPRAGHLREMVKARIEKNDGSDAEGPNIEKWNEVVIDEHMLLDDIWYDPAPAIVAFVYTKSDAVINLKSATMMMQEYTSFNQLAEPIPLIEVDDTTDEAKKGGPFSAPSVLAAVEVVV